MAEKDSQEQNNSTAVGVEEEEDTYSRQQKHLAHNRQKVLKPLAGLKPLATVGSFCARRCCSMSYGL
jgi:hypothetical protein